MVTVSGWLNEPDVPEGDADIARMDLLDCAPAHARFGRPPLGRIVAPSLVSRMVRKSMGQPLTQVRPLDSLARPLRSAGLPPTVALALALLED